MQYRNLISIEEYKEYLNSHIDLDGILEVHRWLSIRYCVYFPYRKGEKDWYFLFLMGSKVPYNHAMNMLDNLRNYPLILFGSLENKIYG
jgi:hypothetical protein